jgi:hypothetical protein
MVRRTAFTQLRYSYAVLAGTVAGMVLVFVVPALMALTVPWHGLADSALLGVAAWAIMTLTYAPTLRDYGLSPVLGLTLPLTAGLYSAMTVDSALAYRRGRGGAWKGRHYDSSATPGAVTESSLKTGP